MTHRHSAEEHARAATDALNSAALYEVTSRDRMAALNLAKTHAALSQAYAALAGLPGEDRRPRATWTNSPSIQTTEAMIEERIDVASAIVEAMKRHPAQGKRADS